MHPRGVVAQTLLRQQHDQVACGIKLTDHAPGDRLELFAQFGVLDDQELPRLGTNGAGRQARKFEDCGEVFIADAAVGVVGAGCAAAGKNFESFFGGYSHGFILYTRVSVPRHVIPAAGAGGTKCGELRPQEILRRKYARAPVPTPYSTPAFIHTSEAARRPKMTARIPWKYRI